VVVPLLAAPAGDAAGGGGGAFGALYFSHEDAPCDFSNMQAPILGFVNAVTPVLHARLAGKAEAMKAAAAAEVWGPGLEGDAGGPAACAAALGLAIGRFHWTVPKPLSAKPTLSPYQAIAYREGSNHGPGAAARARASPRRHVVFDVSSSGSEPEEDDYAAKAALAAPAGGEAGAMEDFEGTGAYGWSRAELLGPSHSGCLDATDASFASGSTTTRLSKVSARRLCTEAMLRVLQHDIRRSRRRSLELEALADLQISEPLGRGGYGCVFKGTWHSVPAAIKVGWPGCFCAVSLRRLGSAALRPLGWALALPCCR
jgi:hypothetical protein